MNNADAAETTQTGTNGSSTPPEFVRMDLGAVYRVRRVIIGAPGSSLVGGWTAVDINGCDLQHSLTAAPGSWTTSTTISGLTDTTINEIPVDFSARYIQVTRAGFIGITEFSARTTP
jgi:hypothetical protein